MMTWRIVSTTNLNASWANVMSQPMTTMTNLPSPTQYVHEASAESHHASSNIFSKSTRPERKGTV